MLLRIDWGSTNRTLLCSHIHLEDNTCGNINFGQLTIVHFGLSLATASLLPISTSTTGIGLLYSWAYHQCGPWYTLAGLDTKLEVGVLLDLGQGDLCPSRIGFRLGKCNPVTSSPNDRMYTVYGVSVNCTRPRSMSHWPIVMKLWRSRYPAARNRWPLGTIRRILECQIERSNFKLLDFTLYQLRWGNQDSLI